MQKKKFLRLSNFFQRDDWISRLNSWLTFCYRVPFVEKCLELCPNAPFRKKRWHSRADEIFLNCSFLNGLFLWKRFTCLKTTIPLLANHTVKNLSFMEVLVLILLVLERWQGELTKESPNKHLPVQNHQ